ncbi:phage baseplate assembly protein V [Desulfarculus baarsii]
MANPFEEIGRRLTALESALRQLVRVGFVVEQIPAEGKVRVEFRDADMIETFKFGVLTPQTRCNKDWWLPDLGEQVLCLCLPYGLERGFIVGSFFSQADPPPLTDPDKRHLRFLDGGWLEYDRATGEAQVHAPRTIRLAAGEAVIIDAPILKCPIPAPNLGQPELRPVEPSPIPAPEEWPHD